MNQLTMYFLALHTTPEIDGMVIMSFVIFTLVLTSIGLLTKYKVFLLFAIGGNLALIEFFREIPALIVVLIGMSIFNIWFATMGSRE